MEFISLKEYMDAKGKTKEKPKVSLIAKDVEGEANKPPKAVGLQNGKQPQVAEGETLNKFVKTQASEPYVATSIKNNDKPLGDLGSPDLKYDYDTNVPSTVREDNYLDVFPAARKLIAATPYLTEQFVREVKRNGVLYKLVSEMLNHQEFYKLLAEAMGHKKFGESVSKNLAKALMEEVAAPMLASKQGKEVPEIEDDDMEGDEDFEDDEMMGDEDNMEGDEDFEGNEDFEGDEDFEDDEMMGDEDFEDEEGDFGYSAEDDMDDMGGDEEEMEMPPPQMDRMPRRDRTLARHHRPHSAFENLMVAMDNYGLLNEVNILSKLFGGEPTPEEAVVELEKYLTRVAKIMNVFSRPKEDDVIAVMTNSPQFKGWSRDLKQNVLNLMRKKGFDTGEGEEGRTSLGDYAPGFKLSKELPTRS